MTATESTPATADSIRNGVDVAAIYHTLGLLKTHPELGAARFRAINLHEVVERAQARSAVDDKVTNGVPVKVEVEAQ